MQHIDFKNLLQFNGVPTFLSQFQQTLWWLDNSFLKLRRALIEPLTLSGGVHAIHGPPHRAAALRRIALKHAVLNLKKSEGNLNLFSIAKVVFMAFRRGEHTVHRPPSRRFASCLMVTRSAKWKNSLKWSNFVEKSKSCFLGRHKKIIS